jgi:hypothetical protein
MSDSTENLDKAQKNQKQVGAAESDPETTGPADNLREDAAEAIDEEEDSEEPALFVILCIYLFVDQDVPLVFFHCR